MLNVRYFTTNPVELSYTLGATTYTAARWFPSILWKPKFYYHIPRIFQPVPILSQTNPVHSTHPMSIRSILMLFTELRHGLPSCLFPSGFLTYNLHAALFSHFSATCPAHFIILNLIILIKLGEDTKLPVMRFSPPSRLFNPLRSKYFPQYPVRYFITTYAIRLLITCKDEFLRSVIRLLVTANADPSSRILVILLMEALSSSETSVLTRVTRSNIPEEGALHSHRREHLKSCICKIDFPSCMQAKYPTLITWTVRL
jgi:hypothetical protein